MHFICKCQKIYKINDKAFKFKLYFDSYKSSIYNKYITNNNK